jgi:YNFM family putative membrane transporter
VLQTLSARRLLITTLSIMAASQVAFALAPGFGVALASRIVLGLALPAAFTSLMTVTAATAPPEHVRQAMGVYIATTIVGGFAGRALGGFLAAAWGWQAPFAVMAALLAVNVLLLTRLEADSGTSFARPGLSVIRAVLAAPHFRFSFLTIFCVFFVFAGVLNNLPFRLEVIDPGIRESDIALIYSGYLIGIVTALGANRVSAVLGGERRGLALGLGVFFVATALFAMTRVSWLLVNVFLFSIGMFTVHSLLSAMVNHRAGAYKGVVNGLYIAIYYAGGSLGAWLPAHVYAALGWNNLLHVMNAVVLVAFALMLRIFGTDRGGAA